MGPIVQFTLALAVAITSLAGGSIAWPRFTNQTRPQLLERVHEIVIRTSAGQRTAQVLGVSDEADVKPINLGKMASDGLNGMKGRVQERIQTIVVGNAVNELNRQFDKLPKDQQQHIQQVLCKPLDNQTVAP